MTLQRQLIRLVAASVLPAALAAALLIGYSYDRQSKIIEQRTLETARALVQAVDRTLALMVLATSPYLASGDLAAFHRQAREAIGDLPGNNFVLSDASGSSSSIRCGHSARRFRSAPVSPRCAGCSLTPEV